MLDKIEKRLQAIKHALLKLGLTLNYIYEECESCYGSGKKSYSFGHNSHETVECENCNGTGKTRTKPVYVPIEKNN